MVTRLVTPPPANGRPLWQAMSPQEVLGRLGSSPLGLSGEDARRRLQEYGPNRLDRRQADGPLRIFGRQLNNPLIHVLLASAVIAIGLGKVTDGAVVFAVVLLNSVVGFVQEFRASRAIEALASLVPERATAWRDGRRETLPVADLVPGDLVLLAAGDKVPADLRLVQTKSLHVDEATLTGESVPVLKSPGKVAETSAMGERASMAYGGTMITHGTGTGVVVATGAQTELGRISGLLQAATSLETPLTKALAVIGRLISSGIVAVSSVILAVGLYRAMASGIPMGEALRETLIFAIALAVGAIPEGLPAIVTIALAIGVQRMAARHAIIRKLPAVETLGATTVICSDKTGTLTRNEMTVQGVWTPDRGRFQVTGVGYDPVGRFEGVDCEDGHPPADVCDLLAAAALCADATLVAASDRWTITGDPTEAALVVAAEKAGIRVEVLRQKQPRLDAIPFESENQFMATLHRVAGGGRRLLVKGAPEVLLARCAALDPARGATVTDAVERMAADGMRVLAIAAGSWLGAEGELTTAHVDGHLDVLGLIGMIDPPRQEAITAIQAALSAGIVVKMITGDHLATAKAIGRQLGLVASGGALTGQALAELDEAGLREAAANTAVFARVAPEQKLRLVEVLQDLGHVVAMTGDGVNDAPALKRANIGVAMGITGTSVSKESADVVLADDNFASIVAAVEEGRRVYDNLIKSLGFVLPTNLGLALILMYAVLFLPFDPVSHLLMLPVEPTQILWINLVATVALALPLAFEAKEPAIMDRPPRDPDEPVLTPFVITRTILAAMLMTGAALGLFEWEVATHLGLGATEAAALAEAQTMAVTTVIAFQAFFLLKSRSFADSLLSIGLFSNPAVFAGIGAITLLQLAFIYFPPLQQVFRTAPLEGHDLAAAVLVGLVGVLLLGVERWLPPFDRSATRTSRPSGISRTR